MSATPTDDELAAVVVALARLRRALAEPAERDGRAPAEDAYEQWRRTRLAALRGGILDIVILVGLIAASSRHGGNVYFHVG
jgi:hypothetical protein